MKQIRIKQWFLNKNSVNHYGTCKTTSAKWWNVTKETEKAYHLDELQSYMWQGGWVPKSCVLEEREV